MPYLNVAEVESALQVASAAPNSAFTQLITLPNATWEGRTCHALRLSTATSPRPGIYLLGGIHAREWGSPDILLFFVEQLQTAFRTSSGLTLGASTFTANQVKSILDGLELYVFPQANPDGRNHSFTVDPLWRKNRRPALAGHTAPGCIGVDLNRNYPFMWHFPDFFDPAAPIANSVDPCEYEVYIGPGELSEPETRNVVWLLDQHPPIRFFIDLHSFGQDILYTWGDDQDQTTKPAMNFQNPLFNGKRGIANDTAYREYIATSDRATAVGLANRMRDAIKAVRGTRYATKQAFALYPTAGTSDDYAYSRHLTDPAKPKIYAYTIEWGQTFHPPYAEMTDIIAEITAGLVEFALAALITPT